jgi:hypothetical protein
MRIFRAALIFLLALSPIAAMAQSTVLQGGAWTPGHVPQYSTYGSQPVVIDGGGSGGGAIGQNLSELGIVSRSPTNTYPSANSGNGPHGEHGCLYDAPITNATGFHYLCFDPNALGGGLISYGAGGGAAVGTLTFNLNGATYYPASVNTLVLPAYSLAGNPTGSVMPPAVVQSTQNVINALQQPLNNAGGLLGYSIIGTSGATVPLLNGTNTWSATQTPSGGLVFVDPTITGAALTGVNQFGGKIQIATPPNKNAIVGAAVQDGTNGFSFATGVTGYGYLNSAGNTAFGLFGQCDQHTTGICTNELDTFNFAGAPSNAFPPNESFGTPQILPITLLFGSLGSYPSYSAIFAEAPYISGNNGYVVFEYLGAGISTYGIVIDATTTKDSPAGIIVNTTGASGHVPITMQTKNVVAPNSPMLQTLNSGGGVEFSINQDGSVTLAANTYSTLVANPCTSANQGTVYYITNSNTSTFNASITGTGSSVGLALCNGSEWVFH